MGWNDHTDPQLNDALGELIAGGFLFAGGAPYDVAQQVLAGGRASLTPPQARIFDEELVPAVQAWEEARLEAEGRSLADTPSPQTDGY
jgi:hypothetical protein